MTKKSAARMQRDEVKKQLKENPKAAEAATWNNLTDLYQTLAEALVNNHKNILQLFAVPTLIQNVPNQSLTEKALVGMDGDVTNFSNELTAIRERHIAYSGDCKDENETILLFEIFEAYHNYDNRYNAVILPTMMELTEQATFARNKMMEDVRKQEELQAQDQKQKELLDPNVVSDIEIKDHSSVETPAVSM